MKLSRFYSNRPDIFDPIDFNTGLNVILAEIRLPENRDKDTHNLGKTTIGRLIDFAFLSKKKSNFFLFKHEDRFSSFIFFLEIELEDGSFVTIRRYVEEASKISFKRHELGGQDFSILKLTEWDHQDVAFERARELLDGILDWRAIKPWSYRKVLGYLLRSQDDFRDVFQLRHFASKHADWKPSLAHLLGFNAQIINERYAKESVLAKEEAALENTKKELGGSAEEISKINGILLLKQNDLEKKQALLNTFDFSSQDKENTKNLVNEIDERIAELNTKRYSLSYNKKKTRQSLQEDQILFDPENAKKLFIEAGILFDGQIKKDFEQLIAFNKAITEERRVYLKEDLVEIEKELKQVNAERDELEHKRVGMLSFLSETDIFTKYKQLSNELVILRAEISILEQQKKHVQHLQELRTQIRSLGEECDHLQAQIEEDVDKQNYDQQSLFSTIRLYFSEIIEEVLDHKALLSVSVNKNGHLDFKAEILDDSGNATSADMGTTYRKLLCFAFDLAVLRAHLNVKFPRFIYHDGVLEALDNRKKEKLLEVIRRYADLGIQPVITLIDSDLPPPPDHEQSVFSPDEIILTLHDEGDTGRLFKMTEW